MFMLGLTISLQVSADEIFKCTVDGKTAYQAEPCDTTAKPLAIKADVPKDQRDEASRRASKEKQQALGSEARKPSRVDEEIRAANAQTERENRQLRCNAARRNLGVLKEPRAVFTYNNKGERQYIEDKSRAGEISAAEQRVAENCK